MGLAQKWTVKMNTLAIKIAIALQNLKDDESATAVLEYALVASVVSVGAILVMSTFSTAIAGAFQTAIDALGGPPAP